mgnify:CR=1 FL=1
MEIYIVIIIVFILYFIIRRQVLIKQVNKFNQLLYVEKSPQKYIDEVDKLLIKFQSARERNINLIQKTTGLLYAGRFDESINILMDDIKKIPPNWQHIYYHNLILSLFLNDEINRANDVVIEAKDVFDEYQKRENSKSAIEFIYAVSDFYNGDGVSRKEFFENLSVNGRNDYRIALSYFFLSKINTLENNEAESKLNLEKAKTFGRGSFLENI